MTKELKVTFEPSGRNVFVLPGTPLVEASARAGLVVAAPCGGAGKCGKRFSNLTANFRGI
jgi:uncharacterized 2Fe-2S/4Fe-4S cluster protein (DUF4445 family)